MFVVYVFVRARVCSGLLASCFFFAMTVRCLAAKILVASSCVFAATLPACCSPGCADPRAQVFCARADRRCAPLFDGLGRLQRQPHSGGNGHANLRVCPCRGQGGGSRCGRGRSRSQSCSQGCRHSKRKGRTRVTGNGTPTDHPRFRPGLTADLGSDAITGASVYEGRSCRQVYLPRRSAAVQALGTSWWRSWCKCTGGERCVQVA